MNTRVSEWIENLFKTGLALFLLLVISATLVHAVPTGPSITYNKTETANLTPATQITTQGGSFTTLVLNATTQTPRWKAYAGNVTGKLILDDSTKKSIYDWTVTSVTGEVYATRNSSIDWSTIGCADTGAILAEQNSLNMSASNADSLNATFINKVHKSFYVGTALIQNSTCYAIATYVNDAAQSSSENAKFQEILLKDGSSRVVYATLINQNTTGFNGLKYDFQMIVPENEFSATPTTYYLYAELI